MATPLSGTLGSVDLGDPSATQETLITEWNATIEKDFHDDGDFGGSEYYKQETGGAHDLKGTCRGLVAAGVLPVLTFLPDGTLPDRTFILTSKSGHTYSFIGAVSNFHCETQKQSLAEFTLSFESSGTIERATS